MNTDATYEHPLPASTPQPWNPPPRSPGPHRSIVWVRPSELVATVSPMLGRGVDVPADLVRHARRAPAAAGRAGARLMRSAVARPQPLPPPTDGLGL